MASGKRRRLAGLTKTESPVEVRKRLLHERMEREQSRSFLSILLPVVGLIALIVGFGAYWEGWRKPNQPIAKVTLGKDGPSETITAGDFTPRVLYQRNQVMQSLESLKTLQISDASILTNMAQGQRDNVGQAVQDALVDEALVRLEADRRQIEVTEADIQAHLINNDPNLSLALFGSPTPLPTATATTEVVATSAASATPFPTATVMSDEAIAAATAERATAVAGISESRFQAAVRREVEPRLTTIGLSRELYLTVIEETVRREKLNKAMGDELPTEEAQIEAEFLKFDDKSSAEAAAQAAAAGSSWAELVTRFGPRDAAPAEGAEGAEGAAAGEDGADAAADDAGDGAADALEPTPVATGEGGPVFQEATATAEAAAGADEAADEAAADATAAPADASGAAAAASATPLPSATPNPYASAKSAEPKWLTRYGLRTDTEYGVSDEAELDKLLALKAGGVSGAVQVSSGYLVIHAKSAEAKRAVAKEELETRRTNAVQDWLTLVKDPDTDEAKRAQIDKFPFDDKVPAEPEWFKTYMDNYLQAAPAQPTLDISSMGGQGQSITIGTAAPGATQAAPAIPIAPSGADGGAPAAAPTGGSQP